MSLASLEKMILAEARNVFNNPKLRNKDIQEWSTGDVKAHDGEVVVALPELAINVAIKKEFDKRKGGS